MMIPIVLRMTDTSTRPAAKWLREVTTSVARTKSMYTAGGTKAGSSPTPVNGVTTKRSVASIISNAVSPGSRVCSCHFLKRR